MLNNTGTLLIRSMLTDNGMPPYAVHLVAIPFPKMAAALKAHKVDAAYLPEPFITDAEDSIGAVTLANLDQGAAQGLPFPGYMVTQSWEDKYPKTAAAFRRAILEAQTIANTNLAAVQQGMAAYGGLSRQVAAIAAEPRIPAAH